MYDVGGCATTEVKTVRNDLKKCLHAAKRFKALEAENVQLRAILAAIEIEGETT